LIFNLQFIDIAFRVRNKNIYEEDQQKMNNNKELIDALNQIEREKDISKEILLEAMENSLVAACKNHFGKADNIRVNINRDTGAVGV